MAEEEIQQLPGFEDIPRIEQKKSVIKEVGIKRGAATIVPGAKILSTEYYEDTGYKGFEDHPQIEGIIVIEYFGKMGVITFPNGITYGRGAVIKAPDDDYLFKQDSKGDYILGENGKPIGEDVLFEISKISKGKKDSSKPGSSNPPEEAFSDDDIPF